MSEDVKQSPAPRERTVKKKRKFITRPIIILVLCVVVLAGVWKVFFDGGDKLPKTDRYQAVFLDNGQVFFGKLKNVDGEYLKLENAFYSKKQDTSNGANTAEVSSASTNLSLVRVGDEVYGPEDNLRIRAEQVLFWQNLTPDSKVTKAIQEAQN